MLGLSVERDAAQSELEREKQQQAEFGEAIEVNGSSAQCFTQYRNLISDDLPNCADELHAARRH